MNGGNIDKGAIFGDLRVMEYIGGESYLCECTCLTRIVIKESSLLEQEQPCRHKAENLWGGFENRVARNKEQAIKNKERKRKARIKSLNKTGPHYFKVAPSVVGNIADVASKYKWYFAIYVIRAFLASKSKTLYMFSLEAGVSYNVLKGIRRIDRKLTNSFPLFYSISKNTKYPIRWDEIDFFYNKMITEGHTFIIDARKFSSKKDAYKWLTGRWTTSSTTPQPASSS